MELWNENQKEKVFFFVRTSKINNMSRATVISVPNSPVPRVSPTPVRVSRVAAPGINQGDLSVVTMKKDHHHFWKMFGCVFVLILIIVTALALNTAIKVTIANSKLGAGFGRDVWSAWLYFIITLVVLLIIGYFACKAW